MPIRSLKPESGAHGWMKTEWGESRGSILLNQGKFFLYLAPATNVWSLSASLWKRRARPKSAILGLRFLSRRMLIALMSEWTRCASILVWRWASPCAVPNAMLNRLFHSSFMPFAGSVKWTHQLWTYTCVHNFIRTQMPCISICSIDYKPKRHFKDLCKGAVPNKAWARLLLSIYSYTK